MQMQTKASFACLSSHPPISTILSTLSPTFSSSSLCIVSLSGGSWFEQSDVCFFELRRGLQREGLVFLLMTVQIQLYCFNSVVLRLLLAN